MEIQNIGFRRLQHKIHFVDDQNNILPSLSLIDVNLDTIITDIGIYRINNFNIDIHGSKLIVFLIWTADIPIHVYIQSGTNEDNNGKTTNISALIFQIDSSNRMTQLNTIVSKNKSKYFPILYNAIIDPIINMSLKEIPEGILQELYRIRDEHPSMNIQTILEIRKLNSNNQLTGNPITDIQILTNIDYKKLITMSHYDTYLKNLINSEDFFRERIISLYSEDIMREKPNNLLYSIQGRQITRITNMTYKQWYIYLTLITNPILNVELIFEIIKNNLTYTFQFIMSSIKNRKIFLNYFKYSNDLYNILGMMISNKNVVMIDIFIDMLLNESDITIDYGYVIHFSIGTGDIDFFNYMRQNIHNVRWENDNIYTYYYYALNSGNVDMISYIVEEYQVDEIQFFNGNNILDVFFNIQLPVLKYLFEVPINDTDDIDTNTNDTDNTNKKSLLNKNIMKVIEYDVMIDIEDGIQAQKAMELINTLVKKLDMETIEYTLNLLLTPQWPQEIRKRKYSIWLYGLLAEICYNGKMDMFIYFYDKIKEYYYNSNNNDIDNRGSNFGNYNNYNINPSNIINIININPKLQNDDQIILFNSNRGNVIVPNNELYTLAVLSGNIDLVKYLTTRFGISPKYINVDYIPEDIKIVTWNPTEGNEDTITENLFERYEEYGKNRENSVPIVLLSLYGNNIELYKYLVKLHGKLFESGYTSWMRYKNSNYNYNDDEGEEDDEEEDEAGTRNDRGDKLEPWDNKNSIISYFASLIIKQRSAVLDFIIKDHKVEFTSKIFTISYCKSFADKRILPRVIRHIITNYISNIDIQIYNGNDNSTYNGYNEIFDAKDFMYNTLVKYGLQEPNDDPSQEEDMEPDINQITRSEYVVFIISSLIYEGYFSFENVYNNWKVNALGVQKINNVKFVNIIGQLITNEDFVISLIKIIFQNKDLNLLYNKLHIQNINLNLSYANLLDCFLEACFIKDFPLEDDRLKLSLLDKYNDTDVYIIHSNIVKFIKLGYERMKTIKVNRLQCLDNIKYFVNDLIYDRINSLRKGKFLELALQGLPDERSSRERIKPNTILFKIITSNSNLYDLLNSAIYIDNVELFQYFAEDYDEMIDEIILDRILKEDAIDIFTYVMEIYPLLLDEQNIETINNHHLHKIKDYLALYPNILNLHILY